MMPIFFVCLLKKIVLDFYLFKNYFIIFWRANNKNKCPDIIMKKNASLKETNS